MNPYQCIVLSLCSVLVFRAAAATPVSMLSLQVGEVRVLAIPDVARLAVGDGHVINAVTTEEKEVIIFARHEGSSALQIWSESGERRSYQIDVAPEGARQVQKELLNVLERIPKAKVSVVGDKLLVEGDELSDIDRERIIELGKRYPQLIDFTGQVGWDRMVLLNVKVIELPRLVLQELGVRWANASDGGMTTALAWDAGSRRFLDRPGETVLPIPFSAAPLAGYFGVNALMSARINAMAQTGDAVVLAEPQLLARSGAVAEFLAGGEVPYSTVDANGNTNTVFKPYGVSLRITPRIERNAIVRSSIEVEVSSVDTTYAAANGPSLKTRRAATEFNVASGQTLVLAGFLSREDAQNTDTVPGLADIPLLGRVFSSRRVQRSDTELAIFVTPVLVSADHPDIRQRVDTADALLADRFPELPRLNTAVRSHNDRILFPLVSDMRIWDPHHGPGSQWSALESSPHTTAAPTSGPLLEE